MRNNEAGCLLLIIIGIVAFCGIDGCIQRQERIAAALEAQSARKE